MLYLKQNCVRKGFASEVSNYVIKFIPGLGEHSEGQGIAPIIK